ncbi:unnamed protein product [Schistosoma margrebowiei]|uniref:Uncharacterized protein n=1 Tax=Schistosoma margrebowiei TaxID=48269 RepID=A0A183MB25_9TREM|nr:unnamed protein product [Schistosoma margrebowiei]
MAIKQIKSGQATGSDNIPAEALKSIVVVTVKILHILFSMIWDKEQLLTDWKEGHLIKITMKSALTNCDN